MHDIIDNRVEMLFDRLNQILGASDRITVWRNRLFQELSVEESRKCIYCKAHLAEFAEQGQGDGRIGVVT